MTSIVKEAERLPAADRIRLVEHLLATLDRAWVEEGERRLDSYLRGETTARDARDVLAKHLKP